MIFLPTCYTREYKVVIAPRNFTKNEAFSFIKVFVKLKENIHIHFINGILRLQ